LAAESAVEVGAQFLQRVHQLFPLHRLEHVPDRPEGQGGLGVVASGHHVNRDVAGAGVVLQPIKYRQPGVVGQPHIEHDGARPVLSGDGHPLFSGVGDQALEAEFACEVVEDASERLVVFNHQDRPAVGGQSLAVVLQLGTADDRRWGGW